MKIRDIIDSPYIIEDTGLFIECLDGFPGPYSSYVLGTIGLEGILKLLSNVENRKAYFKSVGVVAINKSILKIFRGILKGYIAYEKRGRYGFGYDPIFMPEKMEKTLAELSIEEKNKISHRGRLFEKMANYIVRNSKLFISKYRQ
jgi:XTP/dITP diphosphohydrolase